MAWQGLVKFGSDGLLQRKLEAGLLLFEAAAADVF
jgi:hypothetical protein